MRTDNNNGKLTIFLENQIDSSNAPQVEADIFAILDAQHPTSLVMDAADLHYISSAGLRVMLKLKKKYNDMVIKNVSSDVYEIFDVTGFTEIITVKKALRTLDVSGCEILDKGANGTVYRIDPDTIVKVYRSQVSIEEVQRERELARKAFVLGVPTAIPYDVVQVGDCYGAVFELLNAKSFAQLIREGVPVEPLAKVSADILKIMHGIETYDRMLPQKKPVANGWAIRAAQFLPTEIGDRLIELFEAIPESHTMLHGDFHIKNVMRMNDEDLLIDMDTLSVGHPVYELSAVFSAYEGFAAGNTDACATFLGITKEQCRTFLDALFRYYFDDKSEEEVAQMRAKAALISYTRIYRWMIERFGENDAQHSGAIEFCRNYLIENTPKIDTLYF